MGNTKYDIPLLPKGTINRYLIERKKSTPWSLPDSIPDNVYQALLYHGENPWPNEDIAEKFKLTQEQDRLGSSLWRGAKKFYASRGRGPFY